MFCYGFVNAVAIHARTEYQSRFRQRRLPNLSVFGNWENLVVFRDGKAMLYDLVLVGKSKSKFAQDPSTSTKVIMRHLGMTQWKLRHTVLGVGLHPYHLISIQVVGEGDPAKRIEFYRFMLNANMEHANFLLKILCTGEFKFDHDEISDYPCNPTKHYLPARWVPGTF